MSRVNHVVKLIIDYSYKILCKQFNIQYDNDFMNYNDNIQYIFKNNKLRTSNFDFLTPFHNAFMEIVNNYNNSLDNNTKKKMREILYESEIVQLMKDWGDFLHNHTPQMLKLYGDNKKDIYQKNLSSANGSKVSCTFFTELLFNNCLKNPDPNSNK